MQKTVYVNVMILVDPEWADQAEDVLSETFDHHPEILDWAYVVSQDGKKLHPIKVEDDYSEGNFIHPNSPSYIGRQ